MTAYSPVNIRKRAQKGRLRPLSTDNAQTVLHWEKYIFNPAVRRMLLLPNVIPFSNSHAQYFAKPVFIPDSTFTFANANWMINVTVRNTFILSNPRMVCFSN